jgi:hypothetical protein
LFLFVVVTLKTLAAADKKRQLDTDFPLSSVSIINREKNSTADEACKRKKEENNGNKILFCRCVG